MILNFCSCAGKSNVSGFFRTSMLFKFVMQSVFVVIASFISLFI